jgi:hypothetical protein
VETFECECCKLEYLNTLAPVAWEDYTPPALCKECIEHWGKPLETAKDHAWKYHERMEVATNAAYKAHDEAAAQKAEAQRAFNSRERAIGALEAISTYHHRRDNGSGCVCGKHNCSTLAVLSDPWVAERLVDYSLKETGHNRHRFHTKTGDRPNLPQRDRGYWAG